MVADTGLAHVAAAIAEPARAAMLCALLDGRARTATELAAQADVAASTASAHLARLVEQRLLQCVPQGKHRYYQLAGADAAQALEALLVLSGRPRPAFRPATPSGLRVARTCYDHMAGEIAVHLLQALTQRRWLVNDGDGLCVTREGTRGLLDWGIDLDEVRQRRRRFACPCLDWSERRPHLGGALGAALLTLAQQRRWVQRELDGRALRVQPRAWREWLDPLEVPRPA
ncbi:ArsR/SmtB family transcription factor [Caldimonas brevitalea]|uniref:ArsR family transcriptional regulator n=1 Tax=Caldimonas brevitalea TaxID=413882 RepID=A0A0G3BLB8_9BURK|nr:helix-turn-helix domain-containing protein [Caldimonas brevitalea]AKJ28181.1 ArsR family transcriptional regulator [Caldimonas brevitalea]